MVGHKEQNFLVNYGKKEIADELVRISKLTGNNYVTRKDIETYGRVHYDTIKRKFGGLISALVFAKLVSESDKKRKYGRVSKEELFNEIGRIWEFTLSNFCRRPFIKDFKEHSAIAPWAWESHFGSFRKALADYLIWEKQNLGIPEISNSKFENFSTEKAKNINSFTRRTIPPGMRWQVLSRDNYSCTICGKDPKQFKITLEVDHIVPWSKGGPTEINNLRALCSECNKGKSNDGI